MYIAGCTMLGLGLGMIFGQTGPGVIMGLGIGMLLDRVFDKKSHK